MAQVSKIDDYRQQKAAQPPRSPIERLLADARLRLVETGTRNRLVHTPRGGKRTRSVAIAGADADGLCETLVRSNRAMGFVPANPEREVALEIQGKYVNRSPSADVGGLSLRTNLDEQKLEKRLLSIYRDAKTAEEEQGINILFLAIGFLRWYEDEQSDVAREAPLILVPVSLTRDLRRSTFQLRSRDEDIATNQAIQERLRSDFSVALPDVPEGEDWRPTDYFSSVSDTTWRLEISKTTSAGVAYPSAAAVLRSGVGLEPDVTGFYDEATGSVQYLVADPITRAVRSLTRCSTLIQRQAPLREITPEHYDRVFALNAKVPLFLVQKLLPMMGSGGSIILVASAIHYMGLANHSAYAATKAALRSYSRTWAAEFKDSGIRANTLSPGVVDTKMLDDQANSPEHAAEIRKGYTAYTPMLNSPIPTNSPTPPSSSPPTRARS